MQPDHAAEVVWAAVVLLLVALAVGSTFRKRRHGRGGSGPGPAAAGAIYDLLNQDKRNAIELIVEEKAAARDAEDADGNLPDLQNPRPPR